VREDLTGGESYGAWATGQHGKLQVTPQAAGSEGGARSGQRPSREAIAGAGAAVLVNYPMQGRRSA
jgi:hypothetical protein